MFVYWLHALTPVQGFYLLDVMLQLRFAVTSSALAGADFAPTCRMSSSERCLSVGVLMISSDWLDGTWRSTRSSNGEEKGYLSPARHKWSTMIQNQSIDKRLVLSTI